ncbi:hypothetical protein EJB05_08655 [Eragrostis curvula]|uniref:DNA-directed RNA polymerase III subunit RPC5 n=1 Tax=Eragrostis curvula TaxID=38414 RepID=A0A5J9W2T4_9POAL|nr:hypothetical protein EJB05_08655 [Eragrostis curvula]
MATGGDKPPSLDDDIDIEMADAATLDAPATSSAAATRFAPRARGKPALKPKPKPKPKPAPKAEAEPKLEPETEAEAEAPVRPTLEDRDDAMDVDAAGKGAGLQEGEEEEDDDFVVREIDVYFTPKPFDDDGKLYVLQYPLRPCWRPYELNEICEEVRFKPLSSKVEIDLNVDTQSENYDQDVSAPLRLTKQTLSSSKAADVADYAVGVLKGNLVHLNHIDAVLQLRPSMSYVNSGRSHTKQALQTQEPNGGLGGSMVPSVNELHQLFSGNGRPQDSKDDIEDSEPWISLTYQPAGSNIATNYHNKMVSNEGAPIDFTMSTSDYITSLCPGASTGSKRINRCQAIREMDPLPLGDRLKKWFTEVSQVNRFDALKHLAPTHSEEEILKVLPEYADLVRGLWVCKSSLLFDDGYASKRDKILLEFTKKDSIPSKIVDTVIRPNDPWRNRILFPLCKRREILKDYKLIFEADLSFLKRYPHVVNEQERAWSARETTIRYSQDVNSTMPRNTKNATRSNAPSRGPHQNMSKGKDGSAEGSEDPRISVLRTVFTANKVRSMQAVVRDLRQLAAKYASNRKDETRWQLYANAAKACASLPLEELKAFINEVAVPIHGVFVGKHQDKKNPRNIIILLFRGKDANATLTKQEILETAVTRLKREISEREYQQIVTETCNSIEDGLLVLKNGDEP